EGRCGMGTNVQSGSREFVSFLHSGNRRMEKYARIIGYASALAILLGALALVMGLREGVLFPHHRVRVRFPAIGTLMEDDPVKLRGVSVGRVASIDAENGEAIVTLEFFHSTSLP